MIIFLIPGRLIPQFGAYSGSSYTLNLQFSLKLLIYRSLKHIMMFFHFFTISYTDKYSPYQGKVISMRYFLNCSF